MLKKEYSLHTLSLSAMFLIGNAAIVIPFSGSNRNTVLGFLVAFFASLPIFFVFSGLLNRIYAPSGKAALILWRILKLIAAAAILFISAVCLEDYREFVRLDMLPKTNAAIITAVLAVCIGWISYRSYSALLKFSLFSFALTAIIIIALFIAALPRLNLDTIILLQKPKISDVIKQSEAYFFSVFLSSLPILLYERLIFTRVRLKRSVSGLMLGAAILLICLLSSVMLFGPALAAELRFPYASAISTVTVGNLFTRMDGAAYFVYFAGCTIKIAVSIFASYTLLQDVGIKNKKAACIICTAAVVAMSYIV